MRQITTVEELRELQMQAMDVIDAFCKKNNLNYSLAGGTMIGVVRHKGYIPWDDDIDIYMPRKDYDIFLKTFDGFNQRYRVYEWRNYPGMEVLFAKVGDTKTKLSEQGTFREYGVYVDVFPLDGVSDDEKVQRRIFKTKVALYILAHAKSQRYPANSSTKNKLRWIASRLWPLSKRMTFKLITKLVQQWPNAKNVTNLVCAAPNNPYDAFPLSSFMPTHATAFENRSYQIMDGYQVYLTRRYGDYMKLPPEDQRVQAHDLIAYIED